MTDEIKQSGIPVLDIESQLAEFMRRRVSTDPAHDMLHVRRVVNLAKMLAQTESADFNIVVPAAWLHDCITFPKDSPEKNLASTAAAAEALRLLRSKSYPERYLGPIQHAIEAHSYSAAIEPKSLEARVVQDADRLDALGAIGVARCMLVGGALHTTLYNPDDVFCEKREPQDRRFVLDHFFAKLLGLADQLHTDAARQEATRRLDFMKGFLDEMRRELTVQDAADQDMPGTAFEIVTRSRQ